MPSPEDKRSSSQTDTEDQEYDQDDTNDTKNERQGSQSNGQSRSQADKDPNRPKRKKARRACLACQRAHLTCGDERPCERCVKRGLGETCHDGVRKKAKYLHDAPNEALAPGIIDDYAGSASKKLSQGAKSNAPKRVKEQSPEFLSPRQSLAQATVVPQANVAAEMQGGQLYPFPNQQSSPMAQQHTPQQTSPMQTFSAPAQGPSASTNIPGYGGQFFDPSDPMYNFNISDMNFGNQYGALEFGMLGQMSSGANDGSFPPNPSSRSSTATFDSPFNPGFGTAADTNQYSPAQNHPMLNWQMNQPNQGLLLNPYNANMGGINSQYFPGTQAEPNAYAIGTGPNGYQPLSPASQRLDPSSVPDTSFVPGQRRSSRQQLVQSNSGSHRKSRPQLNDVRGNVPSEAVSQKLHSMSLVPMADSKKPRRNPSQIYSSVTKPYPYTFGFHALTAVLQRRFASHKRLAIARALASIRPSFISCTRTLVDDDLLFMEKSFQRALLEYEDVVSAVGTPTIVCRRTGEVAYAGAEFSLLTGWTRDILLGKEPNLNINTSWSEDANSGSMSGTTSRGGLNTPAVPITSETPMTGQVSPQAENRPQPVFLAELLDDESVVQFYEDFAKLAFADKGSVWSPCKVLKYVTKEEHLLNLSASLEGAGASKAVSGGNASRTMDPNMLSPDNARNKRSGSNVYARGSEQFAIDEQAMKKTRDKNSKVDCVYCWTVRRDLFNMPMMIVLNFLPFM